MTAARTERWQFATLATTMTVTATVSSLGAPLVPTIADRFDVTLASAQWVLTSTLLAAAAATPAVGRWGSGPRRRPVIIGTLVLVLAGCLLAASSVGIGVLIAGRALQGLGLALAPLGLAVARDLWSGEALARRLSLLSVMTVAGAGLGYPLTGFTAELLGLSGAYLLGAGLVALTLLLAFLHLPGAELRATPSVDLAGVVLLAGGTTTLLLGVSRGEHWGWSSVPVVALALSGGVLVAGWLVRSTHLARTGRQPLVDLRLARRPGVLAPNAAAFLLGITMYGLLTLAVLLVSSDGSAGWGLGLDATAAGAVLVPYALMSVSGSRAALWVSRVWGPGSVLPIGCLVFAGSLAFLALDHDSLTQTLVAMAIGGLGSGFSFSSLAVLMVPHLPAQETGSALAFNQLLRYLGFAVGSATTVALLTSYGGDQDAFRATALTLSTLCLVTAVFAVLGTPRSPDDVEN